MAAHGRGTLYELAKGKVVLYLPAAVVRDSGFPFQVGDKVAVRLDAKNKRLTIEKP